VVGDDDESPTGPQDADRCLESVFERAHFVVDCDTKCLKHQCGWIVSTASTDAEFTDQVDQVRSGLEWRRVTLGHDGSCEAARAGELAVFRKDTLQVFDREACKQGRGGRSASDAIHSHVEGALVARTETKAAACAIELMRRDAEIEYDAIDCDRGEFGGDIVETPE